MYNATVLQYMEFTHLLYLASLKYDYLTPRKQSQVAMICKT